tara:strand:- start:788 stop:1087 length:300 start_codon:yes stop_codon:yes gene_type:complete
MSKGKINTNSDEYYSFKRIVLENFDNNEKFFSLIMLPCWIFLYLVANTWTRSLAFIAKKLHHRHGYNEQDSSIYAGVLGFIIFNFILLFLTILWDYVLH